MIGTGEVTEFPSISYLSVRRNNIRLDVALSALGFFSSTKFAYGCFILLTGDATETKQT